MAKITTENGMPKCSGCGETFYVLLWMLDSRFRQPFTKEAASRGSSGKEMIAFAEEHKNCPEPRQYVSDNGIHITDRR